MMASHPANLTQHIMLRPILHGGEFVVCVCWWGGGGRGSRRVLHQLCPREDPGCQGSDVGLQGPAGNLDHVLAEEDALHPLGILHYPHAAKRVVLASQVRPDGRRQLVLGALEVLGPANVSWLNRAGRQGGVSTAGRDFGIHLQSTRCPFSKGCIPSAPTLHVPSCFSNVHSYFSTTQAVSPPCTFCVQGLATILEVCWQA